MLGSADATVTRVVVPREEFTQTLLPFGMRMDEFQVDRYQTGEPMEYRAQIILRDANGEQSKTLRVNHPVHFRGHQLYLMDYDTSKGSESDYCIVMVTRQPWRWLVLAGILIMLGGAFKTFIL
jgi:cytochrome c biogenesis protein ResB